MHIHLKCNKCGSIIDIGNCDLNQEYLNLNNMAEKEKKLLIFDTNIVYTGICSKCKEIEDGKTNEV